MRTKDAYFAGITVVLAVAVGLAAAAYKCVIGPSHVFRDRVELGLTQAQLIDRVGEPAVRLAPGDAIPVWGNAPAEPAERELWIHFVYPESQHRFVVAFDAGKVVAMKHDQN